MSVSTYGARAIGPLARSLGRRDALSGRDLALLDSLPFRMRAYGRGDEVFAAHSTPGESCLVMEGFASRTVEMRDGGRQVTAVQVPGDFLDLDALLLHRIDHSVFALTPCTMGFTPHRELRRVQDQAPHLGRLLWLSCVIDAAIQRVWLGNLGRRTSLSHLAHLICELYLRLEAAGIARLFRFDFAITQQQLSEILGVTLTHTNRILQTLRATGLVDWEHGRVEISDFGGLSRFAGFDPRYLSLRRQPR